MIPGNVDPRRPDKVQRFNANAAATAPSEDLTPDYMNILGPESTTANAEQSENKKSETQKPTEVAAVSGQRQHRAEEPPKTEKEITAPVIPTTSQYGVAIIPSSAIETAEASPELYTEMSKDAEGKDIHTTPSKNDRFKVVKIASSEPFRRGRWKCMDYVDEVPPVAVQATKTATSATTTASVTAPVYLQTQSLPPQQIQQMLMQGGFTAPVPAYFQNSLQSQVVPQPQYYYQAPGMPPQIMVPANFINTSQPYFQPGVVQSSAPSTYQNVQFVHPSLIQTQNSAFTSTGQNVSNQVPANFQSGQSFQSQSSGAQQNVFQENAATSQSHPVVNGYAYPSQNTSEPTQQPITNPLPTQVAKNVVLNSNISTQVTQNQINQMQNVVQPQMRPTQQDSQGQPVVPSNQPANFQQSQNQNPQTQKQPSTQSQNQAPPQPQQNQTTTQIQQSQVQNQVSNQSQNQTQIPQTNAQVPQTILQLPQPSTIVNQQVPTTVTMTSQSAPSEVYTAPQIVGSIITSDAIINGSIQKGDDPNSAEVVIITDNTEDPSKTLPVVNAIDNKIEQAMDLVKSHLMYTVREEVEVLKEKIAELMERIQQLETENNYLRSQLPKTSLPNPSGNTEQPPVPPQ